MLPVASQEVFALSIAPSNSRQFLYPSSGCSSRASQYSTAYGLRCLIDSKSGLDIIFPLSICSILLIGYIRSILLIASILFILHAFLILSYIAYLYHRYAM